MTYTPEQKLAMLRVLLKRWDAITKGETASTTTPIWDIIGREEVEPEVRPGAQFRHPDGRFCIKQHSEGWAVIREAAGMGPAKGKCSRQHDFEGD